MVYRKDFRLKMQQLQQNVDQIVSNTINSDMDRISSHIMNTITPYSRHIRIETNKIENSSKHFHQIHSDIRKIQEKISVCK